MSTTSGSRDEQGRQKPSDRGTTARTKQVKPAGGERSVEASPARDEGKSDVGDGLSLSKPVRSAGSLARILLQRRIMPWQNGLFQSTLGFITGKKAVSHHSRRRGCGPCSSNDFPTPPAVTRE